MVASADVGSDGEDSGSYGEPEMQDVECLSDGEPEFALDLFVAKSRTWASVKVQTLPGTLL